MILDPKQKLRNIAFYNNLLIIICVFAILCFATSMYLDSIKITVKRCTNAQKETFGPIIVKNKPQIYEIFAVHNGSNSFSHVSGEVIKDDDTLYEFDKELWHESGYDSEGYWSESSGDLRAKLTFDEPGEYYINLEKETNSLQKPTFLAIYKKQASGIPHFILGVYALITVIIGFVSVNASWIAEKSAQYED